MKSLNVRKFLLFLMFATALGFAACGGDSSDDGAPTYTVTFDSDGGSAVASKTVAEGGTITAPAAPTKFSISTAGLYKGEPWYTFAGWFESGAGSAFDFTNTPITANITLKAKWTGTAPTNTGVAANNVAAAIARVNQAGASYNGAYTLVLDADVSASTQILNVTNRQLTIIGIGGERKIGLSGTGLLFNVGTGVSTLTNISLTLGNNITLVGVAGNDYSVVRIYNGNAFIMLAGSKITGNTITSIASTGGGVGVVDGTFTMNGGEISGNTGTSAEAFHGGGGVFLLYGGFTMNGGEIRGNTASSTGGGVYVSSGTFSMNGGEISGNTASSTGGGVYVYNTVNSKFYMVSGIIYGDDNPTLKNNGTSGAALFKEALGTAQYGTFNASDTWVPGGNLTTAPNTAGYTDNTIKYSNGVVVP